MHLPAYRLFFSKLLMFQQSHFKIPILSILLIALVFSSSAFAQARLKRKKEIPSVKLGLSSVTLLVPSLSIRTEEKTSKLTAPIVMPYVFWEKIAFTQYGFELGVSPIAFRSGMLNLSDTELLTFNETGYYFSVLARAYITPQKSKRKFFYPFVSLGVGLFITSTTFQTVHEPTAAGSTNQILKRITTKTSTGAFSILPSASVGADFLFRQTAGFRMSLGVTSGSKKDWESSKAYKVVYDYLSPKFTLGVFIFY